MEKFPLPRSRLLSTFSFILRGVGDTNTIFILSYIKGINLYIQDSTAFFHCLTLDNKISRGHTRTGEYPSYYLE
ncbi:hypothetical protein CN958_23485 [Bacillus cereus]|uniref:Uncharacterized protein n=1 Tax=Bacillus cereus TaxID=1396 RepID=A0A2B9DPZ9_BACCE|nr:hypothetical protein CN958_23485 [Bacillus cereus]